MFCRCEFLVPIAARKRNYFGRLRVLPKKQMPPPHGRCALLRPLWMKQAERTTG